MGTYRRATESDEVRVKVEHYTCHYPYRTTPPPWREFETVSDTLSQLATTHGGDTQSDW